MRSIFVLFVLVAVISLSGCVNALTPAVATITVVPSEIAKSRLIDENCVRTVLYIFGRKGNVTLKEIVDNNKNIKITLIDYELRDYFFTQQICMKVYGY
jgi:hypothetical protein